MAIKKSKPSLRDLIARGFASTDKKFEAIADDIADIRRDMTTKDDIADLRRELKGDVVALAQQVTSIETQLRGMNHIKLEGRVADLEEKVFGKVQG